MTLEILLLIASSVTSSTYGYGEKNCGDITSPVSCSTSAITSSGIPFDPGLPIVAIAAPRDLVFKVHKMGLRLPGGHCKEVILADKMNERWIGIRGFDITPAAQTLLTGHPAVPYWQGQLLTCQLPKTRARIRSWSIHGHVPPARE